MKRSTVVCDPLLLLLCGTIAGFNIRTSAAWEDFELIGVTNINDDRDHRVDLDIKQIKRNVYALSGTSYMKNTCDMDVDIAFQMQTMGKWIGLPYSVPRQTASDVYNNYYANLLMADVGKYSDLPQVAKPYPKDMCKLFEDVSGWHYTCGFRQIIVQ